MPISINLPATQIFHTIERFKIILDPFKDTLQIPFVEAEAGKLNQTKMLYEESMTNIRHITYKRICDKKNEHEVFSEMLRAKIQEISHSKSSSMFLSQKEEELLSVLENALKKSSLELEQSVETELSNLENNPQLEELAQAIKKCDKQMDLYKSKIGFLSEVRNTAKQHLILLMKEMLNMLKKEETAYNLSKHGTAIISQQFVLNLIKIVDLAFVEQNLQTFLSYIDIIAEDLNNAARDAVEKNISPASNLACSSIFNTDNNFLQPENSFLNVNLLTLTDPLPQNSLEFEEQAPEVFKFEDTIDSSPAFIKTDPQNCIIL